MAKRSEAVDATSRDFNFIQNGGTLYFELCDYGPCPSSYPSIYASINLPICRGFDNRANASTFQAPLNR